MSRDDKNNNSVLKNHQDEEQLSQSSAMNSNEENNKSKESSSSSSSTAAAAAVALPPTNTTTTTTTTNNNNSNKRKAATADMSSFLSSMTFASSSSSSSSSSFHQSGGGRGCDCDECGRSTTRIRTGSRSSFFIPNAIQQALESYKRQRPLQRTQERQLIKREHMLVGVGVDNDQQTMIMLSLWQWTLPRDATPLLEFGDSHRLIWVQRLGLAATRTGTATTSTDASLPLTVLKEIGTGVVGSQQEQQGRKQLDWKAGHVYFVPSRKGKAIGWVHEAATATTIPTTTTTSSSSSSSSTTTAVSGPAVLYIVKVPPHALEDTNSLSREEEKHSTRETILAPEETNKQESVTDCSTSCCWTELAVNIVRRMLQQKQKGEARNKCCSCYQVVDLSDSQNLIQAIRRQIPE